MTGLSRTPIWRRSILMLAIAPVLMASACVSTSTPADVSGLSRVANLDGLATAQGKTIADQDRIDNTMARGCATGLVTRVNCVRHTDASDARRSEL